mgnify:CR=1 FL=1
MGTTATLGSVIVAVCGLIATFLKLYLSYKSGQKKESDYDKTKTQIDNAIKTGNIDDINKLTASVCDFEPEESNGNSSGQGNKTNQ